MRHLLGRHHPGAHRTLLAPTPPCLSGFEILFLVKFMVCRLDPTEIPLTPLPPFAAICPPSCHASRPPKVRSLLSGRRNLENRHVRASGERLHMLLAANLPRTHVVERIMCLSRSSCYFFTVVHSCSLHMCRSALAAMPPPQVSSVRTLKEDGLYGEGEEIAVLVTFTHDMSVLGTPAITFNTGQQGIFTLGGRKQVSNGSRKRFVSPIQTPTARIILTQPHLC